MVPPRLFHVSDDAAIKGFQPRPSSVFPKLGNVVWAVDEAHLPDYLLPRECPRVTFCAAPETTLGDCQRFKLNAEQRVVVVGQRWLEKIREAVVYLYELPEASFVLHDASAGYWLSRDQIHPLSVCAVSDLEDEISRRGADFRIVENLRSFGDEVAASTLDFSIIRMRNAIRGS